MDRSYSLQTPVPLWGMLCIQCGRRLTCWCASSTCCKHCVSGCGTRGENAKASNVFATASRPKRTEVLNLIHSTQADVLVGTETWLTPDHLSSEYFPTDQYEVFHKDRPVTICLLCACAILLLVSGIEPNPGPDTHRLPTPCDEPLVAPHRRATTKSTSDDAGAANTANCMQYNRTSPDQPTITCSICSESIHLGCLKAGKYLECQGWRKQEPPQYIGQLFNSPYFKFICHSCVSKPSPILQDINITMRSIEHKLDILTCSVIGATTDTNIDTTTSRQKPSLAETTAKAGVRQIEQSNRLPQQTTHPSPSPSGIANEVWSKAHVLRCFFHSLQALCRWLWDTRRERQSDKCLRNRQRRISTKKGRPDKAP